ncbi:peptidylprolyl isomerase [Saccharicrinis sp. FJH54]|uniref:FKBP-type peptidyl-prolyl cis-trans isomerase n=1 Tax=Saccharicrinis sp. FJH54 TaxID=3344665 RepID=UPI0035D47F20
MKIDRNKFVSLTYELRSGGVEGELKEKAVKETPLTFVFGAGMMIQKFEDNLMGLEEGDNYEFVIDHLDAYGPVMEDRIVDLPKNIFEVDGKIDEKILFEGNVVPMMDASGNRLNGTVVTISDDNVKMDFNHPLAGQDLCFKGEVLEVREASEHELAEAAGIMSGGCGCGSGGCGCGDESCSTEAGAESCGCGSGCGCN